MSGQIFQLKQMKDERILKTNRKRASLNTRILIFEEAYDILVKRKKKRAANVGHDINYVILICHPGDKKHRSLDIEKYFFLFSTFFRSYDSFLLMRQ